MATDLSEIIWTVNNNYLTYLFYLSCFIKFLALLNSLSVTLPVIFWWTYSHLSAAMITWSDSPGPASTDHLQHFEASCFLLQMDRSSVQTLPCSARFFLLLLYVSFILSDLKKI